MALPFFYIENIEEDNLLLVLSEETSRHIIQVLRMGVGERLQLTDGKGRLLLAEIINDNKKKASVTIIESTVCSSPQKKITLAVSLVKNSSRFEWLLEKATELGVTEIIPLICERTEKQHFRLERMKGILVSAMLQSQQAWLPFLNAPRKLKDLVVNSGQVERYIAHCDEQHKKSLIGYRAFSEAVILIGPEGDFTKTEIELAMENNFIPVSLGATRLRTETAAITAAVIMQVD
ncbi:MAG: RsmE family RNA methyltransferase [Ferruginibacter sp.]